MRPRDHFQHCPRCAASAREPAEGNVFECDQCGFRLFFNPAVATAALILDDQARLLCIRRTREPQRGKLAFPGGFVDAGETTEVALRREVREEVGLEIDAVEFLCGEPNDYHYQGTTYPVIDLLFAARASHTRTDHDPGEVCDPAWIPWRDVRPDELAFPSLRAGLRALQTRLEQ